VLENEHSDMKTSKNWSESLLGGIGTTSFSNRKPQYMETPTANFNVFKMNFINVKFDRTKLLKLGSILYVGTSVEDM